MGPGSYSRVPTRRINVRDRHGHGLKNFCQKIRSRFSVSAPVVWDALGLRAVVFVVFWGSWGGPPVLRDKGGLGSQDSAVSSVLGTRRRLRTICSASASICLACASVSVRSHSRSASTG